MEKHDFLLLGKVYVISVIVFAVVFYKEPFFSIVRLTAALAFMSYVPGFFLVKRVFDSDAFRLLFGSSISLAVIGISAYYLGLFGVQLSLSSYVLPALLLVAGLVVSR